MRVLVTEDEPEMARLVGQALREEDHDVDVVSTGERAIDAIRAVPYDLVLLDVRLPGLDGFATCRRMRDRGAAMPVLMLTARDDVDDRVRGLDAGADDYLCKPFSLAELLARVRALLREPGRVVSRHNIVESAWPEGADHRSNVLEVLIKRIREKIDRPFGNDSIQTVRGVGYRLMP